MKINIDDVVFLDGDGVVFTEGVEEYLEKHRKGEPIEPLAVSHQQNGKYYTRDGRHRTYMFYHRLGLRTIDIEVLDNAPLDERDRYHLAHGCVTIKDLKEEPL